MLAAALFVLALATPPAAQEPAAAQVPPGTLLDCSLVTPVDEKTTPVDQVITLKLGRDLKVQGNVLAKKNTTVTARVSFLQKGSAFVHNVKRAYYIVGLQLLTLNIGEKPTPVTGNLETLGPTNTQDDYFVPFSHGPDKWGSLEPYKFVFKLPQPKPGESFIGVVREGLRIPKDLRLVFRTPDA